MSGDTPGWNSVEGVASGWTVDTLRAHIQQQLADIRAMLQERYETQTKAIDAAFIAQQTAMQTALTAAERAVQTASQAAEKAVLKAEGAADKRFEAMNEFRGQLADQASTLMPRAESEARITAVGDKFESRITVNAERLADLQAGVGSMFSRTELEARLVALDNRTETGADAIGLKIETVVATVATLNQAVTQLRASLVGQTTGESEQQRQQDRTRYLMFGIISAIVAVLIVSITLYFGFHNRPAVGNGTTTSSAPASLSARASWQ